jgi:hypothetical protein
MSASILIQHRRSSLYKGETEEWTSDADAALKFWDLAEGLLYCRKHHISEVFLVMKFQDDRLDLKFNVDRPNFAFPAQEANPKPTSGKLGSLA